MAGTEKQKQSLYFPEETLREIMREAVRLDRSLSWTVQQAWRVAREEIKKFPSAHPSADPARAPAGTPAREAQGSERRSQAEGGRPSPELLEFLRGKFDRDLAT